MAALWVPAVFAVAARGLGMVSARGAIGGFVVAAPIYASLGPQGFAVLALFVVGGSLLTRFGYAKKSEEGFAEARRGRRGAKNAFANAVVAAVCALLAVVAPVREPFAAAFVAALGAAFADTAESEVGQLSGGWPRLITNLRPVAPGTDGAISAVGTLAGLLAAGGTALFGAYLGIIEGVWTLAVVWGAAFAGTLVDSVVGAVTPRVGNEATNLLCTLAAAGLTLALTGTWMVD